VTLDVKFRVWITHRCGVRYNRVKKSCMHTLGRTFSQAVAAIRGNPVFFPQPYPQAAHSASGVSAQPVHRPVHTTTRRLAQHAKDCRRRSIEQARELVAAGTELAAVARSRRRDKWSPLVRRASTGLVGTGLKAGAGRRGERRR